MIRQNAMMIMGILLLGISSQGIASECVIKKNNIYNFSRVDTTCKQLILPDFDANKGDHLEIYCTIIPSNPKYTNIHFIAGEVSVSQSNDRDYGYKIKPNNEDGAVRTKQFRINKTAKVHVRMNKVTFIGQEKGQVKVSCEID